MKTLVAYPAGAFCLGVGLEGLAAERRLHRVLDLQQAQPARLATAGTAAAPLPVRLTFWPTGLADACTVRQDDLVRMASSLLSMRYSKALIALPRPIDRSRPWRRAGCPRPRGCGRARGLHPPRVTDDLIGVRHPLLEIAVVELLAIEGRQQSRWHWQHDVVGRIVTML